MEVAGFSPSNPLKMKLQTISNYAEIAGYVARQLEDVGFKIQVDVVPKASLLELTSKGNCIMGCGL